MSKWIRTTTPAKLGFVSSLPPPDVRNGTVWTYRNLPVLSEPAKVQVLCGQLDAGALLSARKSITDATGAMVSPEQLTR